MIKLSQKVAEELLVSHSLDAHSNAHTFLCEEHVYLLFFYVFIFTD